MCLYLAKTERRKEFVKELLGRPDIGVKLQKARHVLLKPNIVSQEFYPTTTHPETLLACLKFLTSLQKEVVVADGPAIDAGDSTHILRHHPLQKVCDRFGVPLVDLLSREMTMIEARNGMRLEMSTLCFNHDFIISLPVLKSHSICFFTGALKNQFGFLSARQRARLHMGDDIFRAIAEVNRAIKPDLFIVDAVTTMIKTNEVRHGGVPIKLGYMLGGTDPVALDSTGLRLLSELEPQLKGKTWQDVPYLVHAAMSGLGNPQAEPVTIRI
jgi:uncharacterized protein (DUF362 family)